jgi:dUTP pyrophosphatase
MSSDVPCRVVLLNARARVPAYAHESDSGADLYTNAEVRIPPSETRVLSLGICIALAPGYAAEIRPRSSMSARGLLVHLGTIDAGYRGPLGVIVTNLDWRSITVTPGDRVAQLVVVPVLRARFELVQDLAESDRGGRGFGSTGR